MTGPLAGPTNGANLLFVKDGLLFPVFIFIEAGLSHAGSAFPEDEGLDTEKVTGGLRIFAFAFQAQGVLTGFGPEVEQVEFECLDVRTEQIHHGAQVHAIERNLVLAEVVGFGEVHEQAQGFFLFNGKWDLQPGIRGSDRFV